MSLQLKFPQRSALAAGVAGAVILWLAWHCARDPTIGFLPGGGTADWILFPWAPDARAHKTATLDTVFRREFRLGKVPQSAPLTVRAAKRFELKISGNPVALTPGRDWKEFSTADAASWLRAGANTIEVKVFNDDGPPAVELSLDAGDTVVRSGSEWAASCAGSSWRHAALASASRIPGAGNIIAEDRGTFEALAEVWTKWVAFAVAAMLIWTAGYRWLNDPRNRSGAADRGLSLCESTFLLVVLAALWVLLFGHNTRLLPQAIGFDARSHLEYIQYLQQHRAVPMADEGFEMFQPPLYYVICAIGLKIFSLSVTDQPGTLLRALGMVFGIAHFTLVFLSLRLLIPGRMGAQMVGVGLAAFLPMHLYLSHYTTNEPLAAVLVSATLYLALRVLKAESFSSVRCAALGLCMGAASLTKVTGLLLVPFVILALAAALASERRPWAFWLRTLGVSLTVCLAICGWYYLRVWIHCGTPFVGNWNPVSGFAWWQDPGYRTAADYVRFGRVLLKPLFSGFSGFADGLYSTLWGDGLCGGATDLASRPPWNHDLMVAGYLLALVPTALLLCGVAVATRRFLGAPSKEQFLLLGFLAQVVFGLVWMSLRVPSYAQAKAFYGLCALVPLGFLGGLGWEVLTRERKRMQFALGTALLVWAMNSFDSMWVRSGAAATHIRLGAELATENKADAAVSEFLAAVKAEPADGQATGLLAMALNQFHRPIDALETATWAVELSPRDPRTRLQLGAILAEQGQLDRAIAEGSLAVQLGPQYGFAYQSLATWLVIAGRDEQAVEAARQGLAVAPYNPVLHYALGLTLEDKGEFAAATDQLKDAVLLRPDWALAHLHLGTLLLRSANAIDGLKELKDAVRLAPDSPAVIDRVARILATASDAVLRNGPEAVRLAAHACALTGEKDPKLLGTLAAAYAETGRFSDAIRVAQQALALAQASGDAATALLCREMLEAFQSQHAYHPPPASPRQPGPSRDAQPAQ